MRRRTNATMRSNPRQIRRVAGVLLGVDIFQPKRSYAGQFLAPVLLRKEARRKARTEAAE
jgi:hypothetical protein